MNQMLFMLLVAIVAFLQAPRVHSLKVQIEESEPALVSIQSQKEHYAASEPVTIQLQISASTGALKIPEWQLPSSTGEIDAAIFIVTDGSGNPTSYFGKKVKLSSNSPKIAWKRGQAKEFHVDLAQFYDFQVTGEYEVVYSMGNMISNSIRISVQGRPRPVMEEDLSEAESSRQVNARTLGWYTRGVRCTSSIICTRGCTRRRKDLILRARSKAVAYARESSLYLSSWRFNNTNDTNWEQRSLRYRTWFGAFSRTNYNKVVSHFHRIFDSLYTERIVYDCGTCKVPWFYAYVMPTMDQRKVIYLCGYYWRAPMAGVDSKAGTLIHEISHFENVAATDDHAYGQSSAQFLAIIDPDRAVENADSHEYFAETAPYFP